jgi:His/Glu/Gln/Arg/opine family amino acid ABC transporter permease subunit
VSLIKDFFATRQNNETIGVIAFNASQRDMIFDVIDEESLKDHDFALQVHAEMSRKDNGEDTGLFIKNIESVQGDERDVVIFSIGYAKNANGRLMHNFGWLNQKGGENRLNVAISRAKQKIHIVTSFRPSELMLDDAKNEGPRYLKRYLEYAFAISKSNTRLLADFNTELQKLLDSGEVKRIIDHYKDLNNEIASGAAVEAETFLGKFKESLYINFVKDNRYMYLVKGFGITIYVTIFAIVLGIVIGFTVAVVRACAIQTGRLKVLDWFCRVYLTVIRGTPVVVQLLIIYFVIFGAVDVDKVLVAIIAFGINSGAYVAEIVRSGIMSIDKGQLEAGRSLGLSYNKTMRAVILPQAFKNVLPALGNEFIVLLKETSVSGYIALQDLTKGGDIIRSQTYDAFLPLMAVALIYLAVVMILSWLLGGLEKRLKKNE